MEQSLIDIKSRFTELFGVDSGDIRMYSPLTLAYIGDAVYELIVRTYIVERGNAPVNILHRQTADIVKAKTQAELVEAIQDLLSEDEVAAYKRGRNAKSYTKAKNASYSDYRKATGCEALIGYLYLQGDLGRALELIHEGLVRINVIESDPEKDRED